MKLLLVVPIILLAGCANTPGNIDGKDIPVGTAACGTVAGVWGTGNTILIRLDETKAINGDVTMKATKDGCEATVSSTTVFSPPKESKPVVTPKPAP